MTSLPVVTADDGENDEDMEVIAIKIGGSSLTDKANKETLNKEALEWFSKTISDSIHDDYTYNKNDTTPISSQNQQQQQHDSQRGEGGKKLVYIVVHGAGSFGHHTAKEYNLKGQSTPPPPEETTQAQGRNRRTMHGLAATRLSVQTLNQFVVLSLIRHGVNAVGISPGFAIPGLQAHFGDDNVRALFTKLVSDSLRAGLVPVLHGDACLYGKRNAGILSGDILMEVVGTMPFVSHIVFLTDVDGVYTSDPRRKKEPDEEEAKLLPQIQIDPKTQDVVAPIILNASGSSHEHDVTGGFKTKLGSAAAIAASGKTVTIVKCGSESGEQAMRLEKNIARATTVFSILT